MVLCSGVKNTEIPGKVAKLEKKIFLLTSMGPSTFGIWITCVVFDTPRLQDSILGNFDVVELPIPQQVVL